jgi:hypothetical protein
MNTDPIEKAARQDASRGEELLRAAQAAQTILIPALIGILAWYREQILNVGIGLFLILIGLLVVAQLVLFSKTIAAKQSVQDLYFHAKDLKAEKDLVEKRLSEVELTAEFYSFVERYAESNGSSALEYLGRGLEKPEDLRSLIDNILEPLVTNGEEVFGFGPNEKWNFVVYAYQTSKDKLVPVWRRKGEAHPSQGFGREWGRGQGHVGFAYANARAIITEDARTADVKNLVSASEGLARSYDDEVYVSFASVPVGPVANQAEPLGVLVATSDRSGRFSPINSRIIAHAALALANAITIAAPDTTKALDKLSFEETKQ